VLHSLLCFEAAFRRLEAVSLNLNFKVIAPWVMANDLTLFKGTQKGNRFCSPNCHLFRFEVGCDEDGADSNATNSFDYSLLIGLRS